VKRGDYSLGSLKNKKSAQKPMALFPPQSCRWQRSGQPTQPTGKGSLKPGAAGPKPVYALMQSENNVTRSALPYRF